MRTSSHSECCGSSAVAAAISRTAGVPRDTEGMDIKTLKAYFSQYGEARGSAHRVDAVCSDRRASTPTDGRSGGGCAAVADGSRRSIPSGRATDRTVRSSMLLSRAQTESC